MMGWIILILIVFAIGIFWYLGKQKKGDPFKDEVDTPLQILRRRFAQGEISQEEYEERRKQLEREKNQ